MSANTQVHHHHAATSTPKGPVFAPPRGFGAAAGPVQAKAGSVLRHDLAAVRVHRPSTEGTAGSTGPIQRMFNGALSHLPPEMNRHIMTFLPQQDIASLAATSHQTNQDVETAVEQSRRIRLQERGRHRRKNIVKKRTAARVGRGLASFAHHRHFAEQRAQQRAQRGRFRLFAQY
jgi:hypothetical protein